jgi:hypothetical protein
MSFHRRPCMPHTHNCSSLEAQFKTIKRRCMLQGCQWKLRVLNNTIGSTHNMPWKKPQIQWEKHKCH